MDSSRRLSVNLLSPELQFVTSRSSGPGGQNVNKVSTKVTLRFDIQQSRILTEDEKQFLLNKLSKFTTQEGVVQMSSQESRSQPANKELVMAKLEEALRKAYIKPKPRKKSKPSKASVQKRLDSKKRQSEKKRWRSGS